ncbi:MAG: hypothetical protein R2744_06780 [Bacteroidales bacterium]
MAANKVFKSTDRGDSYKEISPGPTRQISMDALPMMGKIWPPEAVAKIFQLHHSGTSSRWPTASCQRDDLCRNRRRAYMDN